MGEYYDGRAGILGCEGDEEVVTAKTVMVEGDDVSDSGALAEDVRETFVAIPGLPWTGLYPLKS